jgi:hypothetical protein
LKLVYPVKRLHKPMKNPPPIDVPTCKLLFNWLFYPSSIKKPPTPVPILTIINGPFYIA